MLETSTVLRVFGKTAKGAEGLCDKERELRECLGEVFDTAVALRVFCKRKGHGRVALSRVELRKALGGTAAVARVFRKTANGADRLRQTKGTPRTLR